MGVLAKYGLSICECVFDFEGYSVSKYGFVGKDRRM